MEGKELEDELLGYLDQKAEEYDVLKEMGKVLGLEKVAIKMSGHVR